MSINFAPFLFSSVIINWPTKERLILVALIAIPALILGIIPFLRLNKRRRVSSKHLIPFIIHMIIILVLSFVFAGVSKTERTREAAQAKESVVMFVVDMSDSSAPSMENMNAYMHDLMSSVSKVNETEGIKDTLYGLVVFGGKENDGIIKKS